MAVDDDMIRKNPFKFKLSDVIPNDAYVRSALTKAQQERYLQFIRDHGKDNYYDDIVILLGTGLRSYATSTSTDEVSTSISSYAARQTSPISSLRQRPAAATAAFL